MAIVHPLPCSAPPFWRRIRSWLDFEWPNQRVLIRTITAK
jgi:hypothetical protein